jgi:hypothetical protein
MREPSKSTRSTGAGAGAVAGASGLATIVVWLFGLADVSLSAEVGSVIAGAVSAATLFVWHTGVKNILNGIWNGQGRFEPSS